MLHTCNNKLTQLLQHFVALVQNEVLYVLGVERLVLDKSQDAARSADDNVGAVVLQHFLVLLYTDTTKEDGHLDVVKVLAEPLVLFVDLEGQLPAMWVWQCWQYIRIICDLKYVR